VKQGDHVIPLYTPECRQCPFLPVAQDQSLHRDPAPPQGQGRDAGRHLALLSGRKKKKLHHYMGCSTFANFTVLPEDRGWRRSAPTRHSTRFCYIGCGVTTGIGAVLNTAKVEPGAKCIVFGLGGIGLNVIQGLRLAGADMIIGGRPQQRPQGLGRALRHDAFRQSEGGRQRGSSPTSST